MFPVHWFSIRLSWEWLCLYSQESSPLTLKSSVHLSSVNGWNLKEPKGHHVFLWMNLWRKNSHVMLNAADPTEKFAPLFFIFPSFQQKKLGCKPQTPLTYCMNQSLIWSVNRDLLSTLWRRTHEYPASLLFLCAKWPGTLNFAVIMVHCITRQVCQDVSLSFPSRLGPHFLGICSDPQSQTVEDTSSRPVPSQGSLYIQGIQNWDRASESCGPPWCFVTTCFDSLRNMKIIFQVCDTYVSVRSKFVLYQQSCWHPKVFQKRKLAHPRNQTLAPEEQLLWALLRPSANSLPVVLHCHNSAWRACPFSSRERGLCGAFLGVSHLLSEKKSIPLRERVFFPTPDPAKCLRFNDAWRAR